MSTLEKFETPLIYVIIGKLHSDFDEPSYSTDPRVYKLPVFDEPVSDEDYDKKYKNLVKAFLVKEDAIRFAFKCDFHSLNCPVYEKQGNEWVYSDSKTSEMADELN